MKVEFGRICIETDETTGATQIFWGGCEIIPKVSPALYYKKTWVAESSGGIHFERAEKEELKQFEKRIDFNFGECVKISKHYRVSIGSDAFTCIVNIHVFLERNLLYVNADLDGNESKSDTLAGFIDLGLPCNVEVYRFFHGGPPTAPLEDQKNTGEAYFSPQQDAWQTPCVVDHILNNENLPISYVLGKSKDCIIAFAAINRYGQRGILRASDIAGIPHGLKFVAGNYLPAQKYDHISGGIIAFGKDPYEVTERIFNTNVEIIKRTHVLRKYKEFPEVFEYLGFCTWNTFYRSVNEQGIKDLAANNFTKKAGSDRFKYLIVDDGWQTVNGIDVGPGSTPEECKTKRGLRALSANYKFPGGIRAVVNLLKDQYGFRWVGVWVTASGYWDGVEPNSLLGQKYPIVLSNGVGLPDPFQLRGYYFWADYFRVIRSWGVDFLKIDDQSSLGSIIAGKYVIGEHICNIYSMLQGAAYSCNLSVLNCMCMASDCKMYWTKANVSRVSEDFIPGHLETMKRQIKQCTFNPIYYSLFCWPDDDMLQTQGPTQALVLLHAVSGGPIYVADKIGETNVSIINKLCFPDGRLARLDAPALNSPDCLFGDTDENIPAKMWSYHDVPGWGRTYYIFLANITRDVAKLDTAVGVPDIPNAQARDQDYFLYDRESGEHIVVDNASTYNISVKNAHAKYFILAPILQGIAVLGADEVYNGTKAISSIEIIGARTLLIDVAYASTIRFYIPRIADSLSFRSVTLSGKPLHYSIKENFMIIPNAKGHILLNY